jgi:hypothetical protein
LIFSGAWRFDDIISCGGSIAEQALNDQRRKVQFDDPANIEFTSVSLFCLFITTFLGHNGTSESRYLIPS